MAFEKIFEAEEFVNNFLSHNEDLMVVSDELYHHGIKGQKWGVRRGPPYPLGTKKSSSKKTIDQGKTFKKAKSAVGQILRIIPSPVSLLLNVSDSMKHDKMVRKAKERLDADNKRREENKKIDKETGLRLKQEECTDEEDVSRINPSYLNTPLYADFGTNMNCAFASAAYEIRKRGFDVRAKLANDEKPGMSRNEIHDLWKLKDPPKTFGDNLSSKTKNTYKEIQSWIKEQPDQRGNFSIQWGYLGGHSMSYEINKGSLIIRDCQSGKIYKNQKKIFEDFFSCMNRGVNVEFTRTDNAEPNWKKLKEVIE